MFFFGSPFMSQPQPSLWLIMEILDGWHIVTVSESRPTSTTHRNSKMLISQSVLYRYQLTQTQLEGKLFCRDYLVLPTGSTELIEK